MGNECCKARWNPCPGLDVGSTTNSTVPRLHINREPFLRERFLIGDKAISTPKGLQNPAYHEDVDSPTGKTHSSNGWERATLTVPTEAVAAAIAAATAATAPVPPPRTKRNRRTASPPVPGTAVPITKPAAPAPPTENLQNEQLDGSKIITPTHSPTDDPIPPEVPLEKSDNTENPIINEQFKETADKEEATRQESPADTTEVKDDFSEEQTRKSEEVVVITSVELPSVDENSVLNCSNTVDLLRTVMQRHNSIEGETPKKKPDYSDDFPIVPRKKKSQPPDDRKGSSVSLPGDDVLANTLPEGSPLSKFKLSKKEKMAFDLSIAGTEEHEIETLRSRIKGTTEDDDSSNSESEEDVLRRSSASSGTLEPYDTACSGDETKDDDNKPNPFLSSSPPPTPGNSPRRGSIDDIPDTPVVTQRSLSENAGSISRSVPPTLAHLSLSKSAILLTPRQWKSPNAVWPEDIRLEHHDQNIHQVHHSTAEPSDHQINTRNAMTSFIKGTYSDKLEVPERPASAASSNAGSLGELEEDIYKLLSESKDKLDEDDDYPLPKPAPQNVPAQEGQAPEEISEVPVFSSAELVRKQQEVYIKSMREIRNEEGKEQ